MEIGQPRYGFARSSTPEMSVTNTSASAKRPSGKAHKLSAQLHLVHLQPREALRGIFQHNIQNSHSHTHTHIA